MTKSAFCTLLFTSIAPIAALSSRLFTYPIKSFVSFVPYQRFPLKLTTATATSLLMTSSPSGNTATDTGGLFLFDFDGVVCDSCNECTVSALRTRTKLLGNNAGVVESLDKSSYSSSSHPNQQQQKQLDYPPQWLFDKMREIRPAIEVGWQIPVLLSVFLEQQHQQQQTGKGSVLSVQEIITQYQVLVNNWLQQHNLKDTDMIQAFGDVRDQWIQKDLQSWLDINQFYPGIPTALENCRGTAILVTTKQQRFAIALCRHAGVTPHALPDDRIFGLGQYKNKADVIVEQMSSLGGGYAPCDTYFFEDRWPTLVKCLKDPRLEGVRFHLCAWGYVSEEELVLARAEPRVRVIMLEEFSSIVAHSSS